MNRSTSSTAVSTKYILYSMLAVCPAFGTIFLTLGPGLSAFIRNMVLPPAASGMTAITNTRIPMPPTQWVNERQKSRQWGRASTSDRIDAPVVVKPDAVSNTASNIFGIDPDRRNGSAPKILYRNQTSAQITEPSRA